MVQSPEASAFLTCSSTNAHKRRWEELIAENPPQTPADLKAFRESQPAFYYPELRRYHHHHPLLASRFNASPTPAITAATSTPTPQKHKQGTPPPRNSTFRSSPKFKRMRASSPSASGGSPMHLSPTQSPAPSPTKPPAGAAGRCHVCSRVQTLLAMPSFGTTTVCSLCRRQTCYVCTRKCDACDATICSKCSEEKGLQSFCSSCMDDWKEAGGMNYH
jgi:hypothetical protein